MDIAHAKFFEADYVVIIAHDIPVDCANTENPICYR